LIRDRHSTPTPPEGQDKLVEIIMELDVDGNLVSQLENSRKRIEGLTQYEVIGIEGLTLESGCQEEAGDCVAQVTQLSLSH